jgi:nucleoside-diphosphate-sugar epimerase
MKVLVTGATGFLGSHTMEYLIATGFDTVGTGRNETVGNKLTAAGFSFIKASLEDSSAPELFCGVDAVVHCAALSAPWGRYEDFYLSNVVATEHVIEGCLKHGVKRLIHISTPSVYFDFKHQYQITENQPLPQPISHYVRTKWRAEQIALAASQAGLEVIVLRPRGIFGPGDTAIFPRLIREVRNGKLPVFGDGINEIDITYVENVSQAIFCALQAPASCSGNIYNITNDEPRPFFALVQQVFDAIGIPVRSKRIPFHVGYSAAVMFEWFYKLPWMSEKEPLLTRYTVGTLCFAQTLDISKAKQQLSYRPKIGIDEGIERFAEWWARRGQN